VEDPQLSLSELQNKNIENNPAITSSGGVIFLPLSSNGHE
jgi:hypothetical protein